MNISSRSSAYGQGYGYPYYGHGPVGDGGAPHYYGSYYGPYAYGSYRGPWGGGWGVPAAQAPATQNQDRK